MTMPYYKIEKTREGVDFFYANLGYFNFWDTYLIANTEESNGKVFYVLVNRSGEKFNNTRANENQRKCIVNHIADSVCLMKPEEMFKDFPELLEKYSWTKKYSKYYKIEDNKKEDNTNFWSMMLSTMQTILRSIFMNI